MREIIFLCFILISSSCFAKQAFYFATGAFPTYAAGDSDARSAFIGTGINIAGGLRINTIAFEGGAKRFTIDNDEIGNESYDSQIKDSLAYGGARLFFDHIFSLKAGVAIHHIEMDIYKGPNHLVDEENDGQFLGLYGGMGIVTKLWRLHDLYFESTLYPVPDIGMYFIDMEVGVRIYL